ncbi:MAG: GNAT family N-acetyltransferase [Bacteroidota bacterium]
MKIVLETERLVLREITLDDKKQMFRLHSDPSVQKYTGESVIESIEEMEKAIKSRVHNYKKYGYGRWATFLKNEMQYVGWAGLAYLPEFDEIDLGYRFLPEYWGMGIGTEASRAILDYGFDHLHLERIIAIAMKENKASIRIMEKVGMEFDKFAPYDPGGEDVVWYWCDKDLISKHKS